MIIEDVQVRVGVDVVTPSKVTSPIPVVPDVGRSVLLLDPVPVVERVDPL